MSVGLGLAFVQLFRFSILCFSGLAYTRILLFLCYFLLFCWVYFLQYYARRLAGQNVSEMTNFVMSGMQFLNSIKQQLY